jgi:signal transduction histidine kinase
LADWTTSLLVSDILATLSSELLASARLMMNAAQAMPEGGKLTITAHKQSGMCLITVDDTGEGIAEDIKPNLFQTLFTTKAKGQGFGLAACKRLAKAMNGDITFESEKGNGSKFTVKLPTY